MQESTFQKIMSDPNFDPHGILEEALVEYIKNHPAEVAKDRTALRWLVLDSSISKEIAEVIDVNDIEMLIPLMQTISRPNGAYHRDYAKTVLLSRLADLRVENIDTILNNIESNENAINPSMFPSALINRMSHEQIDVITAGAVSRFAFNRWSYKDWEIATKTRNGVTAFIDAFVGGVVVLERPGTFHTINHCATVIRNEGNKEQQRMILRKIDSAWDHYVCYKCGGGTDVGMMRRRSKDPESYLIKSISGYTLHRKKCDPDNEFLSPHEIFFGRPKTLSFRCSKCDEEFSTSSGLTLHSKTCN